jgi:NAD(P)-dependent dehydrogenase (short-subunit alcohol dehydrogenase family)
VKVRPLPTEALRRFNFLTIRIVDGILYLEAAKFVTGEILHVDGGQSAGH